MDWHYAVDGVSKGPFSSAQMQSMLARGEITAQTLVWSPQTGDWIAFKDSSLALGQPPALADQSHKTYRHSDLSSLSQILLILFYGGFGFSLLSAFLIFTAGGAEERYAMALNLESNALIGAFLLYAVVTSVLFLVWSYRKMANIWAASGSQPMSPEGAVWWWLVPVANLFKPYQALSIIYDHSGAPKDKRFTVLLWFIGFWLTILVSFWMAEVYPSPAQMGTLRAANEYAMLTAFYYLGDAAVGFALVFVFEAINGIGLMGSRLKSRSVV